MVSPSEASVTGTPQLMGSSLSSSLFDENGPKPGSAAILDNVNRRFDMVTFENASKWSFLVDGQAPGRLCDVNAPFDDSQLQSPTISPTLTQSKKGNLAWMSQYDKKKWLLLKSMLNWARDHNKKIYLHNLVYPTQAPNWFTFSQLDDLKRRSGTSNISTVQTARANIICHMAAMRYLLQKTGTTKNVVAVELANELYNNDGTLQLNNQTLQIFKSGNTDSEAGVRDLMSTIAEQAQYFFPGVETVYNENNYEFNNSSNNIKRAKVISMIQDVNARGRGRINAVGLQMHVPNNASAERLESLSHALAEFPADINFRITELDVDKGDGSNDDILRYFGDVAQVCAQYGSRCSGFGTWNENDSFSWHGSDINATMFTLNDQEKIGCQLGACYSIYEYVKQTLQGNRPVSSAPAPSDEFVNFEQRHTGDLATCPRSGTNIQWQRRSVGTGLWQTLERNSRHRISSRDDGTALRCIQDGKPFPQKNIYVINKNIQTYKAGVLSGKRISVRIKTSAVAKGVFVSVYRVGSSQPRRSQTVTSKKTARDISVKTKSLGPGTYLVYTRCKIAGKIKYALVPIIIS